MSPTPVFAATWSATLRRFLVVLLSATGVLFIAGTAMASVQAPRPGVGDAFSAGVWDVEDLPDVAVVVAGVDPADPRIEQAAVPALRQLDGVTGVETRLATSGRLAVEIALAADAPVGAPDRIERTLRTVLPDAAISVGGRLSVDRALLEGINRGLVVGVAPVVLLVAILVAAAFGVRAGLAVGLAVGLSTSLGGLIGARLAGSFDGTLGSTAVPAVLVALLVSTVFTFRLLDWFRTDPAARSGSGAAVADPALAIQSAVRHLVPEVALLFGGIVLSALLLDLIDPGRTPAAVVAAGGIAAALVTLGGLPAVFSAMPKLEQRDEYRLVGSFVPDGRDVPVAALAGFTCFLLGIGLFSVRAPSADLLDGGDLGNGSAPARVAEQLAASGGDASSGIVATFGAATDPAAIESWAEGAAAIAGVAEVGEVVTDDVGDHHLVITLEVPGRSAAAQAVVAGLTEQPAVAVPTLDGVPVAAAETSDAGRLVLWPLVLLLAVTGGLAVLLLLGDPVLAVFAAVLRLLGSAALLGVYHLVAGAVTGTELQIAALVLAVGVGLFEIGFLRRIRRDLGRLPLAAAGEDRDEVVSEAFRVEGRAAMIGLGVAALAGIGLVAGELDVARRLGVAVSTGLVIELFIGTWLLRPAVLGERIVLVGSRAAEPELERTDAESAAAMAVPVPTPIPVDETSTIVPTRSIFPAASADDDVEILASDAAEVASAGQVVPGAEIVAAVDLFDHDAAGDIDDAEDWVSVEDLFGELDALMAESAPAPSADGRPPSPIADGSSPVPPSRTEQPPAPTGAPMTLPGDLHGSIDPADDLAFGTGAPHPLRRSTDVGDDAEVGAGTGAADVPTTSPLRAADRLRRTADRMLRRRRTDGPRPRPVLDLDAVDEAAAPLPTSPATPNAPTDPGFDPEWGRIVTGLLREEFAFQTRPDHADLETVFVEGTPLFGELREHNLRLRTAGLWVRGAAPRLEKLTVVNQGSPATVAVTVLHPSRQLLDRDGRELGVRAAERREGLLWLVQDPSGRYRIAEAVDLGVVTPIDTDDVFGPAPADLAVDASDASLDRR